jgi:hypothetical protein
VFTFKTNVIAFKRGLNVQTLGMNVITFAGHPETHPLKAVKHAHQWANSVSTCSLTNVLCECARLTQGLSPSSYFCIVDFDILLYPLLPLLS